VAGDSKDPALERKKTPSEIISLSASDVEQLHGDTGRFEAKVSYRKPDEQTPSLTYLAVSVARAVARTAPRGQDPDAALGEDRLAAAREIEALASRSPIAAAPAAVLALKDLVHDVLRLRERAALLNSTSASAYSTLNITEHKLIELRSYFDRILAAVARCTSNPDLVLIDSHAAHGLRVGAAETALAGGLRQDGGQVPDAEHLRTVLLDTEQQVASARRLAQQGEAEITHLRAELTAAHRQLSDTAEADRRIAAAEDRAKAAEDARSDAEARANLLAEELARTTADRNHLVAEATSQSEELSRLRAARRDSQALVDALARVGELEEQVAEAETRAPTQTISLELDELRAAKRDSQALSDALARVGALEEQMFAEKELAEVRSAELAGLIAQAQTARESASALRAEAETMAAGVHQAGVERAASAEAQAALNAMQQQMAAQEAEAQRRIAELLADVERHRESANTLEATLDAARAGSNQFAERLATAESALVALRADSAAATQAAQAEIERVRSESQQRIEALHAERAGDVRAEVAVLEGRLAELEARRAAEQAEAQRRIAELITEVERHREAAAALGRSLEASQAEAAQAVERVVGAESTITLLRSDFEQAHAKAAAAEGQIVSLRSASEAAELNAQAEIQRVRAEGQQRVDAARSAGADGVRAEVAAALERQLTELEDRRAMQAADYERRLAEADAEVLRQRHAAERLHGVAQQAADARARLAAATAAAQVRLATISEEAGDETAPDILRASASALRALPPDGGGEDGQAIASLDTAVAAIATLLGVAQRSASQAQVAARRASEECSAADLRAQRAAGRAEAAETRAADAEGRCEAALVERDQARTQAEQAALRADGLDAALAALRSTSASESGAVASQLHAARYEAAALLVRAETGERERDAARSENDQALRDLAVQGDAASRLLALLREIAGDAGNAEDLAADAATACSDGSAAEVAAALRNRLASDRGRLPALEQAVADAHAAVAAAAQRAEATEHDLAILVQDRDSARAERDGARAEAVSLQDELATVREQVAGRTADLASAREQLAVAQAEMTTVRSVAELVPGLQEELAALVGTRDDLTARLAGEGARAAAAEGAVDELLDAARSAASAAAAALDRFGLLDAGDSRRLTRATVRLEQAEDTVAATAGLGHELLDRATGQIGTLADRYKAIDLERLELRDRTLALDADLAAARAATAALDERLAASERIAAALLPAEARISELDSELSALRGRLDDALRGAETERRDTAVALAAGLAEAEARADGARVEVAEANARVAELQTAAESARLAADEVANRLLAVEAESAARLEAVESGLTERDARIAELAAALDRSRTERGEAVGLAARLRALDQRLQEAQRENARLAAERSHPAAQDGASHAALQAAEHRARGLEAALAEERVRAEALVRARDRAAIAWQERLDGVLTDLNAERNRLADLETALATARAELAGAKARLRSLTSSETTR
jgi:chromosome segregation ATPase